MTLHHVNAALFREAISGTLAPDRPLLASSTPYDQGGRDVYYGRPYWPNCVVDGVRTPLILKGPRAEYRRGYYDEPSGRKEC